MSRIRPRAHAPADYGPSAALSRREIVHAPAPDMPSRTVRRAQAVCHYHAAWRAKGLSDVEHEAADKIHVAYLRHMGARDGSVDRVGDRPPPHMRDGGMIYRMDGAKVLREAREAVGREGYALLELYAGQNFSAAEIAAGRRENVQVCTGRIRAMLALAAERWGM